MAPLARVLRMLTAASAVSLAACVTHQDPLSGGDARVITESEVDSAHAMTALELIQKLRPQFLIERGKLSLDPRVVPPSLRVYVDEQYYGDASSLRGIQAAVIESVRYYTAGEAQYKYGHDNAAGVIAITTKR